MTPTKPCSASRRGSAYVLVLGVVAIATAAGVLGVQLRGMQIDAATTMEQQARTASLARSALEIAIARIAADDDWRETYDGVSVLPATTIGAATVLANVAPVSGNLKDGPATLTARARAAGSIQEASVVLDSYRPVMNSLSASLVAGDDLTVNFATMEAPQPIRANQTWASAANIKADSEVTVSNFGLLYTGSRSTGIEPELPDPAIVDRVGMTAVDVFKNRAGTSDGFLLAPTANTLGSKHQIGEIYFVDCDDQELTFSNFRVLGTLIFINNSKGVTISGGVRMDPMSPNVPVLLSDGDLTIDVDAHLVESVAGQNMNPPDVPWDGNTDNDSTDIYTSGIGGLIYAMGDITIKGGITLGGPAIATDDLLINQGTMFVADNPDLRADPPAEFRLPAVTTIDPFSFRN